MINVNYNRKYCKLTIDGHAGSNEIGHDLVCAGVTILARTLAENAKNMEKNGHVYSADIAMEEGHAEIQCKCKAKYRAIVNTIFTSLCVGFEILANVYPEFISYEIHG